MINVLCLFLSYYYLNLQDLLLKFGRYMYLYFIKAYVEGHIVSYRGLVMKAPKLKTAEIPNYIHQC